MWGWAGSVYTHERYSSPPNRPNTLSTFLGVQSSDWSTRVNAAALSRMIRINPAPALFPMDSGLLTFTHKIEATDSALDREVCSLYGFTKDENPLVKQ